MCLIAFAIQPAPGVALLLAANRDEALDRPTLPLHHWVTPQGTPVVGGRDQRDGGTWLAATGPGALHARVAMLTNVRHGRDTTRWPLSRGELPLAWLDGMPLDAFALHIDPTAYGAFNLVVGDLTTGQWHWLTNRNAQHQPALHCQTLQPGVYGLSNAALDTPWPKTVALRTALQNALPGWVDQSPASAPQRAQAEQALWATLANSDIWPDDVLPQTGVPLDWERTLSAIWVNRPGHLSGEPGSDATAGYGTRTSALMSVSHVRGKAPVAAEAWECRLQEHTWRPQGQHGRRVLEWVV